MSDEPRFISIRTSPVEGWVAYAEWLEKQPFDVEREDGTVVRYEPKTISELVAEGATEYTIVDASEL